MSGTMRRGLLAGAVGTTALNLTTYLDMAVRGRAASAVPRKVVEASARTVNTGVPGKGSERDNRAEAIGALSGIAAGLGTGVVAAAGRSLGLRLSPATGAVVTGALAMAGSDGPAAALGVTDPRHWSPQSWAADVVPHLAYGAAAHATLRALEQQGVGTASPKPPSAGLLVRTFVLGMASGARASMGLVGAAFGARKPNRLAQAAAAATAAGELAADKHPAVPSRLEPRSLASRFAAAAAGSTALADRDGATADLPLLVTAAGATAGALLGAAWRETSRGVRPGWQSALAEDAAVVALTAWAVR